MKEVIGLHGGYKLRFVKVHPIVPVGAPLLSVEDVEREAHWSPAVEELGYFTTAITSIQTPVALDEEGDIHQTSFDSEGKHGWNGSMLVEVKHNRV
jgi:hypothetical protein